MDTVQDTEVYSAETFTMVSVDMDLTPLVEDTVPSQTVLITAPLLEELDFSADSATEI